MSVRRYKVHAGQHGYKLDRETCAPIPGSHTQPELVTAIDERDVQALIDAVRETLCTDAPCPACSVLRAALEPFQSEEEQG